jgi:hypothetical protein
MKTGLKRVIAPAPDWSPALRNPRYGGAYAYGQNRKKAGGHRTAYAAPAAGSAACCLPRKASRNTLHDTKRLAKLAAAPRASHRSLSDTTLRRPSMAICHATMAAAMQRRPVSFKYWVVAGAVGGSTGAPAISPGCRRSVHPIATRTGTKTRSAVRGRARKRPAPGAYTSRLIPAESDGRRGTSEGQATPAAPKNSGARVFLLRS